MWLEHVPWRRALVSLAALAAIIAALVRSPSPEASASTRPFDARAAARKLAYAGVLAARASLPDDERPDDYTPRPIPERYQRFLAALATYRSFTTGDDEADIEFLQAHVYWRYDHLAEAEPLLRDLLVHHHEHETAEYAANLLLDSYNRLQQYDRLLALAHELLADDHFLADKPDLRETLENLVTARSRAFTEKL